MVTWMGCAHFIRARSDLRQRGRNIFKACAHRNHGGHGTVSFERTCRFMASDGQFRSGISGVVAALYAFGVHNGGGFDVATYAAVINAVIYSGIGFLLLHKKTLQ